MMIITARAQSEERGWGMGVLGRMCGVVDRKLTQGIKNNKWAPLLLIF